MRIERDILNQFRTWKEAPDRKPILLRGARQTGKSWAMDAFGKECFSTRYKSVKTDAFKVYACDCGLLRRLAYLPATVVTNPIANYTEFKGAMAENAVLQSMMPLMDDQVPHYWTSQGTAEVEFIIQWDDEIIPVEVKAEENISGSSLSVYSKKYAPPLPRTLLNAESAIQQRLAQHSGTIGRMDGQMDGNNRPCLISQL